jgi:hypothetical protein
MFMKKSLFVFSVMVLLAAGCSYSGYSSQSTGNQMNGPQGAVSVKNFGAVGDGVSYNDTAFANAIAKSSIVTVPPGTYAFQNAVKLTSSGSQIQCADPSNTILEFTGATDGIVASSRSELKNIAITNCRIETTNANGLNAINISTDSHISGNVDIVGNYLTTSGSGHWTNSAIQLLGVQGAQVENNNIHGAIANGLFLGDGTTAVTDIGLKDNVIGSIASGGICMRLKFAQDITSDHDYCQGDNVAFAGAFNPAISLDGSSIMTIEGGTVIETDINSPTQALGIDSSGSLFIYGMTCTGYMTECIHQGTLGQAEIYHLYFNSHASAAVVTFDSLQGRSTLNDSSIKNSDPTGAGVAINAAGESASVTNNYISVVGGNAINTKASGSLFSGNTLVSKSGYGISIMAGGASSIGYNNNVFNVAGAANVCSNCNDSNVNTASGNIIK